MAYTYLHNPISSTLKRALRKGPRIIHNCSNSPFPILIKICATTGLARYTATGLYNSSRICPRAIMSSNSVELSLAIENLAIENPPIKERTYLDYKGRRQVDVDLIRSTMTCTKFHDSVWGFVIYRCSQSHEAAWLRLLQELRDEALKDLRFEISEDLLEYHDLHIIDDRRLYGATSDQVRDHFRSWVATSLEQRLRPGATDSPEDVGWLCATSTPRYQFCLFVDDICLESVDHPGTHTPVIKILDKDWESPFPPEERNYTVPAPYHDGATEYMEEDVGWMYMQPIDYLGKYTLLGQWDWDSQYVRPPYQDGLEDEDSLIGHWRQVSADDEG
ncbi:hypothetical protein F5Y08DRAFT_293685 [Xylaria arbuscula]|nr:hypothetical protein F5Y08DRAFT_293685 [Xylaria arbuscula]